MSDDRRRNRDRSEILVLGLGRFGTALAEALERAGRRVLAVDADRDRVALIAPAVSQAVVADFTNIEALRQIGATEFDIVVVAVGENLEASVLATAALVDLGIPTIWARAVSGAHERILERVGAHHIVQPLRDSGRRVARLVAGDLEEFVALDDGFSIAEVIATSTIAGRTLAELELRRRFGITVVCTKPAGGHFAYTTPDTVLSKGDLLVIAAGNPDIERFAEFLQDS